MKSGWRSFYSCPDDIASCPDLIFFFVLMPFILQECQWYPQRTLRSYVLVYVFPDGCNMIGTPWEMYFQEPYLIRSKQGGIYGFTAFIAIIPEIKLGKEIDIILYCIREWNEWNGVKWSGAQWSWMEWNGMDGVKRMEWNEMKWKIMEFIHCYSDHIRPYHQRFQGGRGNLFPLKWRGT